MLFFTKILGLLMDYFQRWGNISKNFWKFIDELTKPEFWMNLIVYLSPIASSVAYKALYQSISQSLGQVEDKQSVLLDSILIYLVQSSRKLFISHVTERAPNLNITFFKHSSETPSLKLSHHTWLCRTRVAWMPSPNIAHT